MVVMEVMVVVIEVMMVVLVVMEVMMVVLEVMVVMEVMVVVIKVMMPVMGAMMLVMMVLVKVMMVVEMLMIVGDSGGCDYLDNGDALCTMVECDNIIFAFKTISNKEWNASFERKHFVPLSNQTFIKSLV